MTLEYLSGNRIQGTSADRFTSSLSLTTGSTETGMTANTVRGFGNRFGASHSLIGKTVTKVTIDFKTAQSGTITVGVYNASGVLLLTLGTLDANTLTSSFVAYTFENQIGVIMKTNYIIGWSVSGNTATGVIARRTSASADANIEGTVVNDSGTWTGAGSGDPNQDYNMIVYTVPTTLSSLQDDARFEETDTETIYKLMSSTNPTFQDDFSSDNWFDTGASIVVSGGAISFNHDTDGSNDATHYDLITVSDTQFLLRFKLTLSSYSAGASGNDAIIFFGLSSASGTTAFSTAQDCIGFAIARDDSAENSLTGVNSDGAQINTTFTSTILTPTTTTYYLEVIRFHSTRVMFNVYSDSAFTTLTHNTTLSIPSTTTGLRYLKCQDRNVTTDATITGTIDDVKFWNGVTSLPNWWAKQ